MTTLEPCTADQTRSDTQGHAVGGAAPTPGSDQAKCATQAGTVAAGSKLLADQLPNDTQSSSVGEAPTPGQTTARSTPSDDASDQASTSPSTKPRPEPTGSASSGTQTPEPALSIRTPIEDAQERATSPVAISFPDTIEQASPGTPNSRSSQGCGDAQTATAATGLTSATDQMGCDTQPHVVGGALNSPSGQASTRPTPNVPSLDLADPLLALAADVLDDLERVRIANENRLRQLTRSVEDKDGEERGFGLTLDHPDVARLAALVEALGAAEKQATKNLEYRMKRHPLGPWVKQARGVGEKQAARLLAALGDPYWNDLYERPRLVSELWSYAGYGNAALQVRRKGVKANWSDDAKKRCFLVATSIIKAGGPYREVYDEARAKYDGALHAAECRRCGPKGKPALPGSPLSAGHQHARGLRAISKAVLRDLWREAKRLHELPGDQADIDTQGCNVAGVSNSSTSQLGGETHETPAGGGPT